MTVSSRNMIATLGVAALLLTGCVASEAPAGEDREDDALATQGQTTVDCDAGDSLADAVGEADDGAHLLVSGTCDEAVFVPRALTNVTLDGQGEATVQGPDADSAPTGPESFTFFVEGQSVTITGFTVAGGAHAVHLSGPASATITENHITESRGAIHLDKGSVAQIAGNTITDNLGYGINVQEDSYARIGFTAPTRGFVPNTIRDNDGVGIKIDRWSSAWIGGNEVAANGDHGVLLDRGAAAEVAGNSISGNAESGIHVSRGTSVILDSYGEEIPAEVSGNNSAEPNGTYGLACEEGGSVSGGLGTLAGESGTLLADPECEDMTDGK